MPPSPPRATLPNVDCVFTDPGNDFTSLNYPELASTNGPANSCVNQANCLDLWFDGKTCSQSGGYLYCQVCIYWSNRRGTCRKSVTDTISHTCLADELFPIIPGIGAEPAVGSTQKLNGWGSGLNSKWDAEGSVGRGRLTDRTFRGCCN